MNSMEEFIEILKKSRLQTRQDLQKARAKVDELAELDVKTTEKIEAAERALRERGAA